MVTTAIVFDHRGRAAANGKEGPLEVRITVARKSYYVPTGVKVRANEWKFGRVVNRGDADVLTRRVEIIERRVADEVNNCIDMMIPINVSDIKRRVWGISVDSSSESPTTFLDWFEDQIPLLQIGMGTRRHYYTTLARLRACDIIRCWDDVTAENIYRFDCWMHGQKKPLTATEKASGKIAEPIADSTIHNQHKNLKHIIWRAVSMGYIRSNPYDKLRGKFKRGDKETVDFLTDDEVAKIMAIEPTDAMMRTARDLFVFQCFTGLSYSDLQRFDIKGYRQIEGRWISVGERVKTGVPFVLQLLPPAVSVLKRYGMQLPKISNQKYNQALKAIGMACGIKTRMHSHLARHTFATWALRNGAKIENVKAMLGHRKIDQTIRYAKVVAASVHEDFNRMERLFANQEG